MNTNTPQVYRRLPIRQDKHNLTAFRFRHQISLSPLVVQSSKLHVTLFESILIKKTFTNTSTRSLYYLESKGITNFTLKHK